MASGPISRDRINLDGASILLLDDTPMGMSILVQIVTGLAYTYWLTARPR